MKKWNTQQWILISGISVILVFIIIWSIIGAFHTAAASWKVRTYLSQEIRRAESLLSTNQWHALMVEVGHDYKMTAYPCLLPPSFYYPESLQDLEGPTRDHFNFTNLLWDPKTLSIPELKRFDEVRIRFTDRPGSKFPYRLINEPDIAKTFEIIRYASQSLDPNLTIFAIEKGGTYSWEIHTSHISGPQLPPPSTQVSDVQVLSRLCVHALNWWGSGDDGNRRIRDRLYFEDGSVYRVDLTGATDETIDLLRDVPNLTKLLAHLRTMDLNDASISGRSRNFLKKELPHVEILTGK